MYPAVIPKTLAASSANNIATSQTPGAAGNLTLNGTTVTGGVAVLDTQRQVLLTFAGNETGHNFTLVGTNDSGAPVTEVIAGTTAGTVASVQNYKTITRVAISAAAAGAIQVGTNGVGSTPWKLLDVDTDSPMNLGLVVIVTGTVNFTVNYCYDDPNSPVVATGPTAFAITALSAKAATTDTNVTFPIMALQLVVNSGTGTATMVVIQQGIAGS